MIDISAKKDVERIAVAEGRIKLKKETIMEIKRGNIKKGNPLVVAEIASLLAIKNTFSTIPHCHQIPITSAKVDFEIKDEEIVCRCEVKAIYKTGVEMEALHGVLIALLTIWDMVKYLEKDDKGNYPTTLIKDVRVLEKIKGE